MSVYYLLKADHPSRVKQWGIYIYLKNHLSLLKVANTQHLKERINFEVKNGSKLCNLTALYRSSNQFNIAFETFIKKLEYYDRISVIILKNGKTTNKGSKVDGIALQFVLHLLINESTYLTRNTSSCIDLTVTSPPKLISRGYILHCTKIAVIK